MIRFTFTPHADRDIEGIADDLKGFSKVPALRIGGELQQAIQAITKHPAIGHQYRTVFSVRVLRFVCGQYLIFYHVQNSQVRFLAFLHGKRDIDSIMRSRLE